MPDFLLLLTTDLAYGLILGPVSFGDSSIAWIFPAAHVMGVEVAAS